MASFCTPQDVRDYLGDLGNSGQYTDAKLVGFIEVASSYLQSATGRQFENQPLVTKLVEPTGAPYIFIPDARTITAVRSTTEGVATTLAVTTDYLTIKDTRDPTMTIALRVDSSLPWRRWSSVAIDGSFGYLTPPPELVMATKVLAGWYAKRPDAVFGSTIQTESGNVIDVSRLPYEVWAFIKSWDLSPVLVA